MRLFSLLFFIIFIIIGCGYKPSAHYSKNEITGKVFVKSQINIENHSNSIIIKDVMNEMVINKFNSILVDKESEADTLILVKILSVNHSAISTDKDGYTQSYRTTVFISVSYKENTPSSSYQVLKLSNYYDYTVDSNSILTIQNKLDATRIATTNALSNLFSKIAIKTFRNYNK